MMDDNNVVRRGRGRPAQETSKKRFCGVRLDDEETEMLTHLEIEFGFSASEIFRNALKMYYNYMIRRL